MLSFHVKFVQTDRQMDRWTMVKQYAPDLLMQGHKKKKKKKKMMTTSIFSISLDVFFPFQNKFRFWNHVYLVQNFYVAQQVCGSFS